MIVGSTNRNQPAWHQAYRALEHGYAKNQCNNRRVMDRFPPEIRQFGVWFVYMQRERETADYDPGSNFSRSYVFELISYTAAIIAQFEDVERDERRAFAVFVLFRLR